MPSTRLSMNLKLLAGNLYSCLRPVSGRPLLTLSRQHHQAHQPGCDQHTHTAPW